jgi:hypothetical protein
MHEGDFTPEQEAHLAQIALHADTDAEHFCENDLKTEGAEG